MVMNSRMSWRRTQHLPPRVTRTRRQKFVPFGVCLVVVGGCDSLRFAPSSVPETSAVGIDDAGWPVVENCGTFVVEVVASDRDSGDLVWRAADERDPQGRDFTGASSVTIGRLPNEHWVVLSGPNDLPQPSSWRIEIFTSGFNVPTIIELDARELTDDDLVLESGEIVSRARFFEDECGDDAA